MIGMRIETIRETIMGRRKLIRLKRGNHYLSISVHMEDRTKCPTRKRKEAASGAREE